MTLLCDGLVAFNKIKMKLMTTICSLVKTETTGEKLCFPSQSWLDFVSVRKVRPTCEVNLVLVKLA